MRWKEDEMGKKLRGHGRGEGKKGEREKKRRWKGRGDEKDDEMEGRWNVRED